MPYHVNYTSISCGVQQVSDLYSRAKDPTAQFCRSVRGAWDRSAHYLFSDVASLSSPGYKLAKELSKRYPGSIRMSPIATNHNSGNNIRVWIFTPPEEFWERRERR